MDLRSVQKPLKEKYRDEPGSSRITLRAQGTQTVTPVEVEVEGELDLAGTLGISKDVPVGFESIRLRFDIDAPEATEEQLRALQEKTERYCVVLQTLTTPPDIQTE